MVFRFLLKENQESQTMESNQKPHYLNPNFMQHPDERIRIIERIAISAIEKHTERIENITGRPLYFVWSIVNEDGTSEEQRFDADVVVTTYFMLPVFLLLDSQYVFRKIFSPSAVYPFKFSMTNQTISACEVELQSLEYFNIMPAILDYLIEKFLYDSLTEAFSLPHPPHGNEDVLYMDDDWKKALRMGTINMNSIDISLNKKIREYEDVINGKKTSIQVMKAQGYITDFIRRAQS